MNYNIYINSNDKMSGKNNNATFQINWDICLPRSYKYYNVTFLFKLHLVFIKMIQQIANSMLIVKLIVIFILKHFLLIQQPKHLQ